MSKPLFRVAQPKQNTKIIIVVVVVIIIIMIIIQKVFSHVNHVLNQIFSFKHKPLFKIFTFAMVFLFVTTLSI